MGKIEIINRLDQTDAADLKQIVHVFRAVRKALNNRQNKLKVAVDQLLLGRQIAGLQLNEQLRHLLTL